MYRYIHVPANIIFSRGSERSIATFRGCTKGCRTFTNIMSNIQNYEASVISNGATLRLQQYQPTRSKLQHTSRLQSIFIQPLIQSYCLSSMAKASFCLSGNFHSVHDIVLDIIRLVGLLCGYWLALLNKVRIYSASSWCNSRTKINVGLGKQTLK